MSGTSVTRADFIAQDGHNYTFRLRASDWVGNVSTWDETTATTAYGVTKYYAFGGKMVALRKGIGQGSFVHWLATDHLGSINLVVDASGGGRNALPSLW